MALAGKSLIAGSLLLLIFLINLIPLPLARGLIGHVRTAVTQDMDWDETLGRLKFVGEKLPDVQSVFQPRPSETALPQPEPRETDTLAAPAQGEVVAFFETASEGRYGRPGIEVLVQPEAWVYAASAGQVAAVETHEYYGICVWIRHGEDMFTFYGGLGEVLVQTGDSVAQGTPLAKTAEGPDGRHILHFQVWVEETPVDPLTVLPVQEPGEAGAGVV
jgi:murein DD-endopeptidase MepM/ murein hydrolase activator NlpD